MGSDISASLPVLAGARELAARHENDLPLVALVDLGDVPPVLELLLPKLLPQDAVLGGQPGDAALEVEHGLDPGEVHPQLLGEPLDAATELDVLLGVQPRVLDALARAEKALLL